MRESMPTFKEYDQHDACGLAQLIATGEVSATEVMEAAIERCERVNPHINAVIQPLYERAREQAASSSPSGPFAGVPFLMKDLGQAIAGEFLRSHETFDGGSEHALQRGQLGVDVLAHPKGQQVAVNGVEGLVSEFGLQGRLRCRRAHPVRLDERSESERLE